MVGTSGVEDRKQLISVKEVYNYSIEFFTVRCVLQSKQTWFFKPVDCHDQLPDPRGELASWISSESILQANREVERALKHQKEVSISTTVQNFALQFENMLVKMVLQQQ